MGHLYIKRASGSNFHTLTYTSVKYSQNKQQIDYINVKT